MLIQQIIQRVVQIFMTSMFAVNVMNLSYHLSTDKIFPQKMNLYKKKVAFPA